VHELRLLKDAANMIKTTAMFFMAALLFVAVTGCSKKPPQPVSSVAAGSNELPMYGGIAPNPAQQEANDKFIKAAVAAKGTPAAASDESVKLGFEYLLRKNDPATAMKRFNQAYLLDPQNGASYQGMAVTVLIRDHNTALADELFKRAVNSPRVNPDVFADYGRFLLQNRRQAEAVPVLQKGVMLDQNYVETGSLLAMALYESG
jgi:Flp pilus assembly protein TadD